MTPEISESEIRKTVRGFMEQAWQPAGYTVPNPDTYPWLWLWDSCFHSLIWAELGEPEKALLELENALGTQNEEGFVSHMSSVDNPQYEGTDWWEWWHGRPHGSCLSQPPMYGHVLAELHKKGVEVPKHLIEKAQLGLEFFVKHRKREGGLIYLVHPWESGMDDSPRWGDYLEGEFDKERWWQRKIDLVDSIQFSKKDSAIFNPEFPVLSVGFNALVAFNIFELESLTGKTQLTEKAEEIVEALENCFDEELQSWSDPKSPTQVEKDADIEKGINTKKGNDAEKGVKIKKGTISEKTSSRTTRTIDPLLVGLVSPKHHDLIAQLITDKSAFGGDYGPSFVHRAEPSFSTDTYWRGSVWPQLTYLFYKMFEGVETSKAMSKGLVRGATSSNFAEHWSVDDGKELGAQPQSWTGLVICVDK